MARLIDADERMQWLENNTDESDWLANQYNADWIWSMLDSAPTVDAVPVVRCKDCTQWGGVAFGNVCRRWSAPLAGMKNCTGPNDFCSYGERRNNEAD